MYTHFLALSYLGLMLIFFLLALLSDIIFPVLVILIMPIPLYFLFRGEVALKVAAGKLRVTWIKKPAFVKLKDSEIQLYEVIRWKLQRNNRGPEIFTIIGKNFISGRICFLYGTGTLNCGKNLIMK
jgi:hypothetical protein